MAPATLVLLLAGIVSTAAHELPNGVYQHKFHHNTTNRGAAMPSFFEQELMSIASNFGNLLEDKVVVIKQDGETIGFNDQAHTPGALVNAEVPHTSIVVRPELAQRDVDFTFLEADTIAPELSTQFNNVPLSTHIYISGPGKSRALTPHTDGGDVFVYQLSGRKQWTLCTPPCPKGYSCDGLSPAEQALMADIAAKHFDGKRAVTNIAEIA